jgi:4-hydroxy-3-polyprenylbenzoate decarboxylase
MIVKIDKNYPGQGLKVLSSLFGTGQMMFTKYLITVSGDVDIRNYRELADYIFRNTDFTRDLVFSRGPLDVLDHASDAFSFGGKLGIDATVKMTEELLYRSEVKGDSKQLLKTGLENLLAEGVITGFNLEIASVGIPVYIVSANRKTDPAIIGKIATRLKQILSGSYSVLLLVVDHTVDISNIFMVAWQILGNSDPQRDHIHISASSVIIDGTIKAYREGGFPRKWPNVVCSDEATIEFIDKNWKNLGLGDFIESPSKYIIPLRRNGKDEISLHGD